MSHEAWFRPIAGTTGKHIKVWLILATVAETKKEELTNKYGGVQNPWTFLYICFLELSRYTNYIIQ
jgi:hypothetical protein